MSAAQAKTVCFTVTGEFLTDFARTRVIEGRWDHGLRTLVEGLHGMTTDQAIAILKGDQKLIGDSNVGVDMVPDDDAEHKAAFDRLFAGVYLDSDGRVLRPYAVVSTWGPEDMNAEEKFNTKGSDTVYRRSVGGKRRGEDLAYRSLFYARDRQRDVLRQVRIPVEFSRDLPRPGDVQDVLFQEVRNYPTILAPHAPLDDPDAAIAGYLAAGRRLAEVGYVTSFPPSEYRYTEPAMDKETEPTLKRTMMELRTPEDIDTLREHQIEVAKKGRIEDVEAIRDQINEAVETIGDTETDTSLRVEALNSFMALKNKVDVAALRTMIKAQAGDDTFDMVVEGKTHKVPRAPFEGWALNRTAWFHLKPAWQCIAPSGLKMVGDDPYHNDWMLGGDFQLEDYGFGGGTPLAEAAGKHVEEVQRRYFNAEVPVLSGAGTVEGVIVHLKPGDRLKEGQIGVIKNAGPDYVQAAQDAITYRSALITEAGGAVAHLVTVFRDQDLKIVRVPNARKVYPEGRTVTVYLTAGCIQVKDDASIMRLSNGAIIKDGDVVGYDEAGL
ncbi:hypothetical protein BAJUN_01120 [Bajunvirus bajun]|uniref:PEP-utilising enzyme mobile domain-containing protein n=1 Tax=Brevundimonas phage vB_BgoS-Bajun TaxID=2948594 RepID=A0A9E7N782_9CAUD|nr:hypothetical protein BAJUN_01120 [Brevundimonas phage vB_BgoS-Bajun]